MKNRAAAALSGMVVAATSLLLAGEPVAFKRIQLSDQFWSEGANAADLNNDLSAEARADDDGVGSGF
jgi:hypothetical protein